MQNWVPAVGDEKYKATPSQFTPVPPQKLRHDGWAPAPHHPPVTPNLGQRSANFLYFRAGSRAFEQAVLG
jgi:hypothetical protein